tara:strand:- start:95921 stop:96823 length:903 start_codon:yes stop_codon:yes gene_type:complete
MQLDGDTTQQDMSVGALAAVLHYYADAGIDCALADNAIDRFEESSKKKSEPQKQSGTGVAPRPASREVGASQASAPQKPSNPIAERTTIPDETAVANAREAAGSAATLKALQDALLSFEGCNLRFGARQTVFADGNPQADIMFVGEAPGGDEDRQGIPFVGRAGQMLDKMLSAIRLDRSQVYITNMIPWRPPGNRTPTPLEIELCRPFIERHIQLVNPKVLVLLGNVSTKALLGTNRGILSFRGTWSEYNLNSDTIILSMPTLHPAYLLRNPAQKKQAWADFLSIRKRLDELGLPSEPGT